VKFLDYKHGVNWSIWEFRAEGTGYPDSEVYNRIRHYPWPDHHPPPFALIPNIMASMRAWLKDENQKEGERVVVVHCKAGKGRSGTVACSYLISVEGWTVEDAMLRFTARRMRSGFGSGISIPSQIRWVGYVDWWTKHNKVYVERQVEVLELHVWGLRDGVKVAIEGYVDGGRTIKVLHVFSKEEKTVMDDPFDEPDLAAKVNSASEKPLPLHEGKPQTDSIQSPATSVSNHSLFNDSSRTAALFRPSSPIILPTSDINVDFERRNKATYGFTMVTSVAHVWFNAFFECQNSSNLKPTSAPEQDGELPTPTFGVRDNLPSSGVFSIDWDAMDGIKGSARKGTRALDRLSVVWRAVADDKPNPPRIVTEPAIGEPVPETGATDWRKAQGSDVHEGKDLGLRAQSPASASISRASSVKINGD